MDFSQFLQELGVYGHLTALLLGMPRFFALVTVAPFFGSAVVTGQIRLLLVLALYLSLIHIDVYKRQALVSSVMVKAGTRMNMLSRVMLCR